MRSAVEVSPDLQSAGVASAAGPELAGVGQIAAGMAWAVLWITSSLSFGLSVACLNIWDRVPAANLPRYFPLMNQEAVAGKAALQAEVLRMGFSLAGFANLLTAFRLVGGLALFILSGIIMWRYPRRLMAMLFAILLAVMGAAGIWNNPLFPWSSALAPWMDIPGKILGVLLWFGLILLYAFPDGRFRPRWTVGLAVLLIPLAISLGFDLPFFLNPGTWPDPLPLLPNLVFIGVGLFSVLYRYRTAGPARQVQLKGYVLGASLLMGLYFVLFGLNDGYAVVTGQGLFQTNRALLTYVLISEPLWFVLELVFAVGAARSIFGGRLLER